MTKDKIESQYAVILLQIVMLWWVLGLILWKIMRTIESQLKKQVLKLKCLGLYVTRQLIWGQTTKLFIAVYFIENIFLLFKA